MSQYILWSLDLSATPWFEVCGHFPFVGKLILIWTKFKNQIFSCRTILVPRRKLHDFNSGFLHQRCRSCCRRIGQPESSKACFKFLTQIFNWHIKQWASFSSIQFNSMASNRTTKANSRDSSFTFVVGPIESQKLDCKNCKNLEISLTVKCTSKMDFLRNCKIFYYVSKRNTTTNHELPRSEFSLRKNTNLKKKKTLH